MLRLIPGGLHRAIFRIAHRWRVRWWRLRKPRLDGCRVLALDPRNRVLLVRHSYGNPAWMLPGGGVGRGEHPLAAAGRELREETGCVLTGARALEVTVLNMHGAANRVHVVAGSTSGVPLPDGREIVEARFFLTDELPDELAGSLREILPGWIKAATAGDPPA